MMNCTKHWTEHAVAQCDECGQDWCAVCLVPPPKDGGPLRCIPCSLVIAGVRTAASGPLSPRRLPALRQRRFATWPPRPRGDVAAELHARPSAIMAGRFVGARARATARSTPVAVTVEDAAAGGAERAVVVARGAGVEDGDRVHRGGDVEPGDGSPVRGEAG